MGFTVATWTEPRTGLEVKGITVRMINGTWTNQTLSQRIGLQTVKVYQAQARFGYYYDVDKAPLHTSARTIVLSDPTKRYYSSRLLFEAEQQPFIDDGVAVTDDADYVAERAAESA